MARGSILEYTEAVRGRYRRATKKEKGKILDEFIQVTSYHRKAAIRLLHRGSSQRQRERRGGRRRYGNEVVDALRQVWEASGGLCSKRLQPFLGELVRVMRQHGELAVSTTKPGSLLKSSIPLPTFADWEEGRPGFLEVGLVLPRKDCRESMEGFYLTTLGPVDVASGWSECRGVEGKGQQRVGAAVQRVRQQLPFPLLGLDSDNGSEFINQHLYNYCRREGIVFTRSRSYKKNDSCHVEQKNWSVVRRLVGYDRYQSPAALEPWIEPMMSSACTSTPSSPQ